MNAFKTMLTLLALGVSANAAAHTVWLDPLNTAGDYAVRFGGHGGKLVEYDAAKLKSVVAFDARGRALRIERRIAGDGVTVHVDGAPALLAVHFDNAIHTRPPAGPSVEKPLDQVPGATKATRAVKYHKTVVTWNARSTHVLGQPFEVVPVSAIAPRAGVPMPVRVLQDGKPVAGVQLGRGEEPAADAPTTDANGVANFVPQPGFNKLWVGRRIAVTGNPHYTELSYEYLLGFWAD